MTKDLPSKLAVLLHADVAGSTELVRSDEALTHQRIVHAFRRFSETISNHDGETLGVWGDALLAEFSKPSDAIAASLAFQTANATCNEEMPDDIRPAVRVGIAMGEVVFADDTVTGEGVVLAQRLEQLAQPGCVCIQGAAYEMVPKRFPFEYENLGKREVKGFDEPVRVYEARLKPGATAPEPKSVAHQKPVSPLESGRPSIAVLAFDNMSGDPEQEYFSDGIAEDIITGLSRYNELVVTARHSSFAFKGLSVTITEAASQLGVRYVLEGSVQKAGNRVRITAQLIEGSIGNHLWAESYDRVLDDLFAVRDDVVSTIVSTLAGRIDKDSRKRAARKSPTNLTAYEHVFRGKHYWNPEGNCSADERRRAREEFEKAVELDPDCAAAYSSLSDMYYDDVYSGYATDPASAGERCFEYARKAVESDGSDAYAHLMLAFAYILVKSNFELADAQLQRAIELNPNDYYNACAKISVSMRVGDYEDCILWANEAIRRNPFLPDFCLSEKGFSEYFAKQYDNAIKTFGRMLAPGLRLHVMGCTAACYAQLGRDEEARIAAAEFRDRAKAEGKSDWDAESWREYWSSLFVLNDPEPNERLLGGLRKAGLP